MNAQTIGLLFGAALLATPASAQMGGQNIPDLSGIAGEIAQAAQHNGVNASGKMSSGLTVPSVNPGAASRALGKQLRDSIEAKTGPNPKLAALENGMSTALTSLESQMERKGIAKRDFGVAVAYAFVMNYETATGKVVPEDASVRAGRTIAQAVKTAWGSRYAEMSDAEKEKAYESLLMSATLMNAFYQQFKSAGKTQDAQNLQQAAAALFQTISGSPASQVRIASNGTISGLKAGANGARPHSVAGAGSGKAGTASSAERAAPTEKRRKHPLSPFIAKVPYGSLAVEKVFLNPETGVGVGGMVLVNYEPYVLFKNGMIRRAPDIALAELNAQTDDAFPGYWGTWKRQSANKIAVTWDNGKTETMDDHLLAKPGPANFKLNGFYRSISGGGNTAMGGDVMTFSQNSFQFHPDGTFTNDRAGGGTSSNVTALST